MRSKNYLCMENRVESSLTFLVPVEPDTSSIKKLKIRTGLVVYMGVFLTPSSND